MVRRWMMTAGLVCALSPLAIGQVKLEYKVPEGVTLKTKSASKIHQVMTVNGAEVKTDIEEQGVSKSTHGKRAADGTIPLEITLESLKMKMTAPGIDELSLDSTDPDLKVDIPQLAFLVDMFKILRGSSYTVVLDAKNKVKFVEGTEKHIAKLDALPPQAANGIKQRFSVDRIKHEFEQAIGVIPDGLVREGEPWERTMTTDLGASQTLTLKNIYEYKGTVKQGGKTLDKIAEKTTEVSYKMDENAATPAKVIKSDLKVASSEGTLLFDREAGNLAERSSKLRLTGEMTLKVGEMEIPVKLDLTIESNATVTKAEPAAK